MTEPVGAPLQGGSGSGNELPPRPPTGGLGPRFARLQQSTPFRLGATAWAWRRTLVVTGLGVYGLTHWTLEKRRAAERDAVRDKTWLLWKIYDGGIVEAKSTGSSLNYLLTSSGGSPEEPPRVMTLFEVIRTIKFIEADDRIHGLIADFSATSVPAVQPYSLGLAQLEEIQDALLELKRVKQEKMGTGKDGWRSIAWTDSFASQGQYLLASAFDEIYAQPTGEVPLVGMGSTSPFFGRLLKWLGIDMHAEARNEYKSFVQPYIDEQFTKPQKENQEELINDLNDNLMTYIARNRFPSHPGAEGLAKVKALSQSGPFTTSQAVREGLLDGSAYRQDIMDSVFSSEGEGSVGDEGRALKGFYHYGKVMERAVAKTTKGAIDVGVVYLLGTIGDAGEFGTASVVRGLREAGEDETIGAVVLRIDSGGGGVVESDTIWAAVRDLRNKGKTVVASFANASASGGYLVSTHTDAILAAPSTITGSIGVASLRPTFLTSFFDRFHVTLDSFFTGSRSQDVTHPLTPEELQRYKGHVDEMYADFKNRVCEGRGINPEVVDLIAGGRVMTGLKAFSLNAPEELIRQIKGLDTPPTVASSSTTAEEGKIVELPADTSGTTAPVIAASPLEAGEGVSAAAAEQDQQKVAVISPDQETSPFAPPEPPSQEPTTISPTTTTGPQDVAAANASAALATSTPAELENPAPVSTPNQPNASGLYPVVLGPFGRGLIDGIGGIRDAAVYACELFIANGLTGYKEDNPGTTDEDAIAALLPDATFDKGPNGETLMQVDVRLKRFPVQKSFWEQFREASRKGDSIDPQTAVRYLKASMAAWVLQLAAGVVANEMDELGLGDARSALVLGLGPSRRRSWMRAEWGGGVGLR
ncbi:hypothetical protein T439DRAFT_379176 [Meredithblackwellia eburnea MCA 4105]